MGATTTQEFFQRVKDIPDVGFYSLPKKMGRTSHFIYDGLRLISLGCNTKTKNTNIVQKPNTVLVASPCPPTASQWAALRIKAYLVDRGNPQSNS